MPLSISTPPPCIQSKKWENRWTPYKRIEHPVRSFMIIIDSLQTLRRKRYNPISLLYSLFYQTPPSLSGGAENRMISEVEGDFERIGFFYTGNKILFFSRTTRYQRFPCSSVMAIGFSTAVSFPALRQSRMICIWVSGGVQMMIISTRSSANMLGCEKE